MHCQLNWVVPWSEKNMALWLIIDLRSRPGRQRTICLKTSKATNRGYFTPHPLFCLFLLFIPTPLILLVFFVSRHIPHFACFLCFTPHPIILLVNSVSPHIPYFACFLCFTPHPSFCLCPLVSPHTPHFACFLCFTQLFILFVSSGFKFNQSLTDESGQLVFSG